MGACAVEFKLDGGFTQSQVRDEFKRRQDEAAEWNEDEEDGFTGDWDSIDYLKFSTTVYPDYYVAHHALCDNTQKGDAVAVKYIDASNDQMWLVFGWAPE